MKPIKLRAIPALLLSLYGAPLSLAHAAGAAAATAATSVPNVAYEKYTLPNGLDVILVEDHKLPVTAVNVWYPWVPRMKRRA